jgi:hypothetical protein
MSYISEANRFLTRYDSDNEDEEDNHNTSDGKTGGDTLSALSLFEDLDEDITSKNEELIEQVKSALNSGKDYITDPKSFLYSLSQSKHKEMLTDYSVSDLSKMKLFKLPNLNIGYALKDFTDNDGRVHKHGELVAVHNNEPTISRIGEDLVRHAVKHGAMALDHFDVQQLTKLYTSMGFKEYARYPYDPQYDPDGSFKNKYGAVDVVYRMR